MSHARAVEMNTLEHHTTEAPAAPSPRTPGAARRVGAVLAGFVAIFTVTTATDLVLHATGIFPGWDQRMSDALFVLAAAYRAVYGVAGCYVTAALAPDRPLRHALALGVLGTAAGIAGAVAMWGAGPAWYPLTVAAMAMPCAWLGAKLRSAR